MFEARTTRAALLACLVAASTVSWPSPLRADGPSAFAYGNFPLDAARELEIFLPKGISAFGIAPNMGFAFATNDGRYVTRNTPQDFADRFRWAVDQGMRVRSISFSPEGGWALVADRGVYWRGIHPGAVQALNGAHQRGEDVLCVTLGQNGAWIVISNREFFTGNLPPQLVNRLRTFAMNGGVRFAALSPHGGASVFANGSRYEVQGAPIECEQAVERASVANRSIDEVAFSRDGGWMLITSRAN